MLIESQSFWQRIDLVTETEFIKGQGLVGTYEGTITLRLRHERFGFRAS